MASKDEVEVAVLEIVKLEHQLKELETNEQFTTMLQMQKAMNDKIAEFWGQLEPRMIALYKQGAIDKTLKGEWGSITIVDAKRWATTDELPAKFYKKVVDTKKLSDTYDLTHKDIKGATLTMHHHLRKDIK